eukprot:INCI9989.1.p1 GENE.INCI9989.1~~INCI9989.1.p1  ORF type:complete len:279 (-),score=52.86 INCI9989.1:347-1183(-)
MLHSFFAAAVRPTARAWIRTTSFARSARKVQSAESKAAAAAIGTQFIRKFSDVATVTLNKARLGIQDGMTHYSAGKFAASEGFFRSVLGLLEAADTGHSRDQHIFQAATRLNLANALREQYKEEKNSAQFSEANALYQQAIKAIRAVYGEHHLRLSKALRERALLLQAVGDAETVEDVVREAIAVHVMWCKVNDGQESVQDVTEERDTRVVECRERVELMVMLAKALKAQGKNAEVAQLEEPLFKCIEYALCCLFLVLLPWPHTNLVLVGPMNPVVAR